MGGRTAKTFIIDAYSGGVGVPVDVPVKNNHRHTLLVHLLDNRRKSRRFIRRNDYYVKSVLNEIFYILDLFCIAVISRTDFDNSILVKHNLTLPFEAVIIL